jgi:hypothetical protein
VPGNVANKHVEMVATGVDKAIVSADRPYRLIVGLDGKAAPIEAPWRETLLYALGESELFLHLAMAR